MTAVEISTALDQYRHDMARVSAPQVNACPDCGQPRARHCQSKTGNRVPFHPARRALVEILTDAEKVDSVEVMRREQHAARMAPLPALTAEQQAVRAATSDAWDALLAAEGKAARDRLPVTNLADVRAVRRPTRKPVAS